MGYFNRENAKEMQAKSVASRNSAKFAPVPEPEPQQLSQQLADSFAVTLSCACEETLELIRKARQPIHRAQLARALRDLRETWHLATGKPRPGLTRPDVQPVKSGPRVYPVSTNPGSNGQPTNGQ